MSIDKAITIAAVGDISLGDHPVCAGHGMRKAFSKLGDRLFAEVKGVWADSDIVMGNLETVASNIGLKRSYLPSYEMRGDPSALGVLKRGGFNLLSVANNHSMQHGVAAFSDTVSSMVAHNLSVIGVDDPSTGASVPFVYKAYDKEHVFLAYSLRPEEWSDGPVPYSYRCEEESILAEIRGIREEYDGFIVLSLHWGLEYLDYPSPDQLSLGRLLIDAGVDVIVGHHPHVLQPYEYYNNGLIIYSLGNFVFDLWHPETKVTAIANIVLREGKKPEVSFVPVFIGEKFIPVLADQNHSDIVRDLLSFDKGKMDYVNSLSSDDYQNNYRHRISEVKSRKYKYFIKNIYRYPVLIILQSFGRTIFRRVTGN